MRAIATYHSIDTSGSPISVSPDAFRRHLGHFLEAGVRIVTLEDLRSMAGSDADAVALTFDDGYASVAREALPLLREHGLPATVFVVTARVGGTNDWAVTDGHSVPELPLLGWEALGRLAQEGVEIASHTRTHPSLPRVAASVLEDEIAGAADDLKQALGRAPAGFAYPYGHVSDAARTAVARVHRWACTTAFRELADDPPYDLPRLDMWYFERPGLLERWGTPAFARWVRRRHRLRQVRSAWRRVGGR